MSVVPTEAYYDRTVAVRLATTQLGTHTQKYTDSYVRKYVCRYFHQQWYVFLSPFAKPKNTRINQTVYLPALTVAANVSMLGISKGEGHVISKKYYYVGLKVRKMLVQD